MIIGASVIELDLPGIHSLKQKRSVLKGLIARLHKEFNISCAEVEYHDSWQSSAIGVVVASNSAVHAQRVIESVVRWIEQNRPDLQIIDHTMEIV